jgi:hypothetical protein
MVLTDATCVEELNTPEVLAKKVPAAPVNVKYKSVKLFTSLYPPEPYKLSWVG